MEYLCINCNRKMAAVLSLCHCEENLQETAQLDYYVSGY